MLHDNFLIAAIYLVYLLLGCFAGAAIGSGTICLVMRRARRESWSAGRSHCDTCGKTLAWRDLIPIASYLLNRGRCRYCGAKIPVSCLVSELIFGFAGSVLIADIMLTGIAFPIKAALSIIAFIAVIICVWTTWKNRKED